MEIKWVPRGQWLETYTSEKHVPFSWHFALIEAASGGCKFDWRRSKGDTGSQFPFHLGMRHFPALWSFHVLKFHSALHSASPAFYLNKRKFLKLVITVWQSCLILWLSLPGHCPWECMDIDKTLQQSMWYHYTCYCPPISFVCSFNTHTAAPLPWWQLYNVEWWLEDWVGSWETRVSVFAQH